MTEQGSVTKLPLTIISDRINPGFKSTRALLDAGDLPGLQGLARQQVAAGASALDFTIGPRAKDDPQFLTEAIRAVQRAHPGRPVLQITFVGQEFSREAVLRLRDERLR